MDIGRVGLWTFLLDGHPTSRVRELAQEIEAMGWPTLWRPESSGRDFDRLDGPCPHPPPRSGMSSLLRRSKATLRMPTQTGNARPIGSLMNGQKNIANPKP